MWNDKMRFICVCDIAPRMPITIVAPPITRRSVSSPPGNNSVSVRMMAYTPTWVSRPAKIAVTELGADGYESGSQKNSGNTAALIPKATRSRRFKPSATPSGRSPNRSASTAMLTVPVAAKIKPTANRRIIDSTTLRTTYVVPERICSFVPSKVSNT